MGKPLELQVTALAGSGEGVARASDGRVVFVSGAAPGDRVRAVVVEEHARFARARTEAVLEAGAERVEPRCAVFGTCGGCTWQHVAYGAQVREKRRILGDALRRVAGLELRELPEVVPSPAPYAYRRRARVAVSNGRVGYRRRGSREVVPTASCPILLPELEAALGKLAAAPPADGEWELVAGDRGAVAISPAGGARRGGRRGGGTPSLPVTVAGEHLRVSAGAFLQASAPGVDRLVEEVVEAAGRGLHLLELHAGVGTFTLPLARRWTRVVAVESDAGAAADLRANLDAAGLAHVRVRREPAERALGRAAVQRLAPETVVLDPPRTGLGRGTAAAIAALGAAKVVYVSCDPATLARDLRALLAAGYRLDRVRGFDLFPQTPHVEAVAVLRAA